MGWKEFRKASHTRNTVWNHRHRFEHWYVDNQVYFITARVRGQFTAFRTREAKDVFWDRFDHYVSQSSYVPWVTSLSRLARSELPTSTTHFTNKSTDE